MLPAASRLRRSDDFTLTVRRGRRAARGTLVVHLYPSDPAPPDQCARAGLIVSKAVGGAVVRNQVARRVRHLLRDRLANCPRGAMIVVRALPASAVASSAVLGADLDAALRRLLRGLPA